MSNKEKKITEVLRLSRLKPIKKLLDIFWSCWAVRWERKVHLVYRWSIWCIGGPSGVSVVQPGVLAKR